MAENAPTKPVPPLPNADQLAAFFKEFHKKPCPVCDHPHFAVVTAPDDMSGFYLYYRAKRSAQGAPVVESYSNPSVFAVVNTMCKRCGYMHSFSLKHIEHWLKNSVPRVE